MAKVKHHGFAHFILFIILGVLAIIVFGGLTKGPMTSFLFLGIQAWNMFSTTRTGNVSATPTLANDLLSNIMIFVINLIIFYLISAIIIFIFNLFFGEK